MGLELNLFESLEVSDCALIVHFPPIADINLCGRSTPSRSQMMDG
jgi:hypothetical protein